MSSKQEKLAKEREEEEKEIKQWKVKKLIQNLEKAQGNGTSMISLIIPAKDQISRYSKMLADEYGTASNIKSRVNRLSVLAAISSAQQRLKLYNKVPPNGLVVYCGTVITEDGKEKKRNLHFEPHKPVNASLYLCDNKFHTEPLKELLESDEKFGFIIVDGNGALFATLVGNTRDILHKFSVDLPKKHGRGGQSALRFARLRLEKRHNFLRKVAELCTQLFITNDRPNVSGLILAGLADFKNDLNQSDLFDQRLARVVLKVVDISYGGEKGFNQAIDMSADCLANLQFIKEKKLITTFFEQIAQDTGKYSFGIQDTMDALESGCVKTLIVYERLAMSKYTLRQPSGEETVKYLTPEQFSALSQDSSKVDVVSAEPLTDYFAENYRQYGCRLAFVSNKSQEGAQFVKGFGGIGALLRYKMDFSLIQPDYDLDDFDFEI